MATVGPIIIEDATGTVQLAGTATFPDGIAADGLSTPDVASGDSDPILVKTGDAPAGDAGNITIQGGDGDSGSGTGGSVTIESGDGDTPGHVTLGRVGDQLGFFGSTGVAKATLTGALSAVTDAAALDVLTSIVAALDGYGFANDGTT